MKGPVLGMESTKEYPFFFNFSPMNFSRLWKNAVLSVALFACGAVADIFDMNGLYGLKYGPNLSMTLSGNTPIVWGQWLFQNFNTVSFNWIEPLRKLPYGHPIEPFAAFLRFSADAEVTPFYGGFRVGIGGRPFEINPQIEARFIYENYTYFNSNVEMTLTSSGKNGNIADSWNSDWITEKVYSKDAAVDFMQNFAFFFDLEYGFGTDGILGLGMHYTLVDISTSYEGKSYDFRRNVPIFSRDFIFDLIAYAYVPLTSHWAVSGYLNQYNTGNSKSSNDSYLKEPLSFTIALLGPSFNWENKQNRLTLLGGYWKREKKRFYKGRLAQQFLIHLQYQRNFGFGVKPVPED